MAICSGASAWKKKSRKAETTQKSKKKGFPNGGINPVQTPVIPRYYLLIEVELEMEVVLILLESLKTFCRKKNKNPTPTPQPWPITNFGPKTPRPATIGSLPIACATAASTPTAIWPTMPIATWPCWPSTPKKHRPHNTLFASASLTTSKKN